MWSHFLTFIRRYFKEAFTECHRWAHDRCFRTGIHAWNIREYSWSVKFGIFICYGADILLCTTGALPKQQKFTYNPTMPSGDEGAVSSDLSTAAAGHTVRSGLQFGTLKPCSTGKHGQHTTMKVIWNSDGQEVCDISSEDCSDSGSMVIIPRQLFCTPWWVKRCGILAPRSTATAAVNDKSWYELVVLVSMCKIGIPVFVAVIFVYNQY